MYIPKHFEIKDTAWARAFMDEHRFATLVTIRDGEPFATHVPLVYEPEPQPYGTLRGHVARANPARFATCSCG
jgi:transcriptional regulator